MAAIMPIIATTMSNSIKEKPCWRFCVFISILVLLKKVLSFPSKRHWLSFIGFVPQRRKSLLRLLKSKPVPLFFKKPKKIANSQIL